MSLFSELKRRNVLRVAIAYAAGAWLVIQVVETLFPVFGLADAWVRTVVIVLVIGFVPAVALSWVYEWTPKGVQLDSEVAPEAPSRSRTAERLNRAIIAFLALAVGYFSLDKFVLEPSRDAAREREVASRAHSEGMRAALAKESIVVLPFTNESGRADDDYFSDGIAEEVLTLLAKVPKLRVISRSSAFSFRDADLGPQEIAAQLNVGHVLDGAVGKRDDRITLRARLLDARTGTELWSESYESPLDGVFEIQDDVVARVLDKLGIAAPGATPTTPETDTGAYTLFLQARHLANQFTPDSLSRAAELYEAALRIDPDYARAWSGLGWVYANQASSGHRETDEAVDLARESTWTALALNPSDARAYANVGYIAMIFDNDLALAARHYQRALEIDPNGAGIVNGAAVLTEMLGRVEEAVELHEYSVARDPVDANRHSNLAIAYITAGRYQDAIRSIRSAMTLSPDRIGASYVLGLALLLDGNAEDAASAFADEVDEEYRVKGRALAMHDLGRSAEADAALRELEEKWGEQWPSEVAQVRAWTGDADGAFEWLDKAIAANEPAISEQSLSPLYRKIHDDPRWQRLLESWGHTEAQLGAIRFDVDLTD